MRRRPGKAAGAHGPRAEIAHAAMRGAIAAMSMTGMRSLTTSLGLVKQTPPEMVIEGELPGLMERLPQWGRDGTVVLAHWAYGAAGGALYGALPGKVRLRRWSGPVYGVVTWVGFDLVVAPLLGLRKLKTRERLMLVADHVLYGTVLAETRTRPRR